MTTLSQTDLEVFQDKGSIQKIYDEFQQAHDDSPLSRPIPHKPDVRVSANRNQAPILVYGNEDDEGLPPEMRSLSINVEEVEYVLSYFRERSGSSEGVNNFPLGKYGSVGRRGRYTKAFRRFILYFADELHSIICSNTQSDTSTSKSESAIGAAAAAVAAWLSDKFGLEGVFAVAVGTAVILTIVYATKGAFCRMAKDELEERLREHL